MPRRIETIAEKLRRYQLDVFRVAGVLNTKAQRRFAVLERVIVERLRGVDPTEPTRLGDRLNRLDALAAELRTESRRTFDAINRDVTRELVGLAQADMGATAAIVSDVAPDLAVSALPPRLVRPTVEKALIDGTPLKDWWRKQSKTTIDQFSARVTTGLRRGDSIQQIVRDIRGTKARNFKDGIFGEAKRRQIETLVRTSVISANNEIRLAQGTRSGADGWQIVTAFDSKVCDICAGLSGGIFDFAGNPLPESPVQSVVPNGNPPVHPNCRCSVTWYWKDEGPAKDVEFGEWLAEQPEDVQDETLGAQRAALWRDGTINLRDLIDGRGNPMTVDELREKHGG